MIELQVSSFGPGTTGRTETKLFSNWLSISKWLCISPRKREQREAASRSNSSIAASGKANGSATPRALNHRERAFGIYGILRSCKLCSAQRVSLNLSYLRYKSNIETVTLGAPRN